MMQPLLEKIDTVHYTQTARQMKEAQEYGFRLLNSQYPPDRADKIIRELVEQYPVHDFLIDAREARRLGLQIEDPSAEQIQAIEAMYPYLGRRTIVGQLREMQP